MASQENFFRRLDAVNTCGSSFEIDSELQELPVTPKNTVTSRRQYVNSVSVASLISSPVLCLSAGERRNYCDEQDTFSFLPIKHVSNSFDEREEEASSTNLDRSLLLHTENKTRTSPSESLGLGFICHRDDTENTSSEGIFARIENSMSTKDGGRNLTSGLVKADMKQSSSSPTAATVPCVSSPGDEQWPWISQRSSGPNSMGNHRQSERPNTAPSKLLHTGIDRAAYEANLSLTHLTSRYYSTIKRKRSGHFPIPCCPQCPPYSSDSRNEVSHQSKRRSLTNIICPLGIFDSNQHSDASNLEDSLFFSTGDKNPLKRSDMPTGEGTPSISISGTERLQDTQELECEFPGISPNDTLINSRPETFNSESMENLKSDRSYEVPDSQPDNTAVSPAPLKSSCETKRLISHSLDIKVARRQPLSTPSPTDPHRLEVFQLMNKANVSPFKPDWGGFSRKKSKAMSPLDDLTPPVTPTDSSSSGLGLTSASPRIRDELDVVIDEAKDGFLLPTRNELSSVEIAGESEGNQKMLHRQVKSSIDSPEPWQKSFSCMYKNNGSKSNDGPNSATIAILQRMAEHYERTRETWRVMAYRKAIGALKRQRILIRTKAEAVKLPGVGKRIADKIEEIVSTSRLRRLEEAESNPDDAVLKTFTQIYGVGLTQARSWISKGFKTLGDLRSHAELTASQRIGLDHCEDFQKQIPRDEVRAHGKTVDEELLKISTKLRLTVGGSYRRGASVCGDVDFLITSIDENMPDHLLSSMIFNQLIPQLFKAGYLRATLAAHSSDRGSKWHGAATLLESSDGPWRRVDFLMVPPREWGAALIYFTGNDIFNRSLRLLARKKGMNLNQHGLYKDVLRGPGMEKITRGTLVEAKDEEAIFEKLGVPYRPPEDRIC